MTNPPEKLPGESATGYSAFIRWLDYPPPRPTLAAFSRELGRSASLISRWGRDWEWKDRADAMDRARLEAAMGKREEQRETVRQQLLDSAFEHVGILRDIANGIMDEGDQVPLLDRHGQVVGTRPAVPPATRAAAARAVLELAGITPPKRVELTGADGAELRLRARAALSDLTGEQLAALARAFGVET